MAEQHHGLPDDAANLRIVKRTSEPTKAQLDNAAKDAVTLVETIPVVNHLLLMMIAARKLYVLSRIALDNEFDGRWEVDNIGLVANALVMAAQTAADKKFTAAELLQNMREQVLPALEIIVEGEKEHDGESNQNPPVPGDDFGGAAGLGDVLPGTDCDQVDQAGIGGEGN